jgi:hypothetical protein
MDGEEVRHYKGMYSMCAPVRISLWGGRLIVLID